MTDKIVPFPITRIDSFDSLTEKEAYYQLRLDAVELLNEVNAGRHVLTEKNIDGLHFVNSVAQHLGFEPLQFHNPFYIHVKKMGYLSEE